MRILILGARVYQLPLIRKARDLGYTVIVASYDKNDPGMSMADEAWVVDTTDRDTLLERSQAAGVDMVQTTGTDVAIPAIGHINDNLGLRGISFKTALNCTDKGQMQKRFAEAKVPAAKSIETGSLEEARLAVENIGLPVMVKAPDSSGSRGISLVRELGSLEAAYADSQHVSRNGKVLIEEFLEGEEFGAQAVVQNGEVIAVYYHDDLVTPPPISVPIGHSVPTKLTVEQMREGDAVLSAAVKALGVSDAVCNCDLILTEKGIKVLEVGARLGATGIAEIIQHQYGVDLWETSIQLLTGEKLDLPDPATMVEGGVAAQLLESPKTGTLVSQDVPDHLNHNSYVLSLEFDYTPGASVRTFRHGPDRIGMVVVRGTSGTAAQAFASDVCESIRVEVK